jgi:hypothetical protein
MYIYADALRPGRIYSECIQAELGTSKEKSNRPPTQTINNQHPDNDTGQQGTNNKQPTETTDKSTVSNRQLTPDSQQQSTTIDRLNDNQHQYPTAYNQQPTGWENM